MTTETAAKKDTQKLQRAIVDGLEDVKGHDIQVFNTEHLSPLFERVIVASAPPTARPGRWPPAWWMRCARRASKPRIEGEDNGEWIIVDCGAAVAHIMQPAIRQYYHLEEIWGEKPIRLRLGRPSRPRPRAPAPAVAAKKAPTRCAAAAPPRPRATPIAAAAARKAPAKKKSGPRPGAKGSASTTARSAAGKAALKTPAKKAAPAQKAAPASAAPARKLALAKKAAAKKSPSRR